MHVRIEAANLFQPGQQIAVGIPLNSSPTNSMQVEGVNRIHWPAFRGPLEDGGDPQTHRSNQALLVAAIAVDGHAGHGRPSGHLGQIGLLMLWVISSRAAQVIRSNVASIRMIQLLHLLYHESRENRLAGRPARWSAERRGGQVRRLNTAVADRHNPLRHHGSRTLTGSQPRFNIGANDEFWPGENLLRQQTSVILVFPRD